MRKMYWLVWKATTILLSVCVFLCSVLWCELQKAPDLLDLIRWFASKFVPFLFLLTTMKNKNRFSNKHTYLHTRTHTYTQYLYAVSACGARKNVSVKIKKKNWNSKKKKKIKVSTAPSTSASVQGATKFHKTLPKSRQCKNHKC